MHKLKNITGLSKYSIYRSSHQKLPNLYNEIYEFSFKNQSSITINKLLELENMNFNNRINVSAQYLYNEIPIRLARRIKDLEKLPFELNKTNGVNQVRKWYIQSFIDFRDYNINNISNNTSLFLEMVKNVYERHAPTLITMAKGIHEIKKINKIQMENISELLDRFYMSRIGIRVLLGHYIELHKENSDGLTESQNYFGIICKETNPKKILNDAIEDASYVATRNNHILPKFNINCNDNILFSYIPSHLYYILFEIIKNSIHATNRNNNNNNYINCDINDDKNLIIIKISDNGIGIKKHNLNKIWKYSYTTTKINLDEHFETDFSKEAPLSGIGYGLPITKLLVEYFGGRIEIFSEYEVGTDVYIYLHKNGNFDEPLF